MATQNNIGANEARFLLLYLGCDLYGSIGCTRRVIEKIDAVSSGGASEYKEMGNSFLLKLNPSEASLINFDAVEGEMDYAVYSLADFRQAIVDHLSKLELEVVTPPP